MPMTRAEKREYREVAATTMKGATALILADYRGLTVQELTQLRVELRKHNAKFQICKNRIFKKAIESDASGLESLKETFTGPLGVLSSEGDAAQATKVALEFEKNHPNFVVRGGFIDNATLSPAELKVISDLPSREVLLAKIIGSLVAPHRGILGVLNGVPRQLVQVINAIKDKKS